MEQAIRGLGPASFDVGLLDSIFMSHYIDFLPSRRVLQEQNIESAVLGQYAEAGAAVLQRSRAFWKASSLSLAAYESRTWPRFALRTVVSESDRREMTRRCSRGRTTIVENGVDVERHALVGTREAPRILCLGSFDYPPNVDAALQAARHVMPLVWARLPAAELHIAGRNPPPAVLGLASTRVTVHASPPEIAALAAQTSLSLVPLRMGGGTRLKILESLAWGLPVVTTTLGCQGLRVVADRHLLIRDSAQQQADAVVALLTDAARWQSLRDAGRRLVAESYSWDAVLRPLEEGLTAVVSGA
jgi:glycosyltransferase involved in cell wall biosynthesis